MTLRNWQLVVGRRIAAALVATPACAPTYCPGTPPPDTKTQITYTVCSSASDAAIEAASDAMADATSDATSDATADATSDATTDASPVDPTDPMCHASCMEACPFANGSQNLQECREISRANGRATVECTYGSRCIGGRMTDGLVAPELPGDMLGAFFARCAWLEAASIRSFERLARELEDHGAPDELVRVARTAAKDEARHARAVGRLAEKYGAKVPRVEHRDTATRPLETIALENATEGCVGETYGALLAYWQADHASDSDVREAMSAIAPDELSHAALAWAIAAWAETRLDREASDRVRAARESAVLDLAHDPDPRLADIAGIPDAESMRAMIGAMFA